MEDESQEHASAIRARLEFPVWHRTFTKAYSAWANAPGDLKAPLLLQGQALAQAESWLLTSPDRLSESQKRFIVRSIALRAKGGAELLEPASDSPVVRRGTWRRSSDRSLWTLYAVIAFGLWLFSPDLIREVLPRALQPASSLVEHRTTTAQAPSLAAPIMASDEPANSAISASEPPPPAEADETPSSQQTPPKASPAMRLADIAGEQLHAGKARPALLLAIEAAELALVQSPPDTGIASRASDLISRALATREVLGPLAVRSATAASTVMCPGGRTIVAIAADNSVAAWTGTTRRTVVADRPVIQTLTGAQVDRDCRRLLLSNEDFNVEIRPIGGGKEIGELKGHEGPVLASRFSPDGAIIATASEDSTARLWDAASGRLRAVLSGHDWHVTGVEFSPDGRRVLTASGDMTTRIWEVASGRQVMVLGPHQGVVTSARFSRDGGRILTTSGDGFTRLWDAANGRQLIALQQPDGIRLAELSPDARRIATTTADGSVQLWDSTTGSLALSLPGSGVALGWRRIMFTPEGRWLIAHAWSGRVDVIDAMAGKHLRTLTAETEKVRDFALDAQAHALVAVTEDGVRLVWPLLRSPEEAIGTGKEMAPACLDADERASFGLASPSPQWCAQSRSRGASLH